MDANKIQSNHKQRFLKLSLKKNKKKTVEELNKHNRSSDVIIIDDSFDRIKSGLPQNVQSSPKIYSPIVLDDSEESFGLPAVTIEEKTPSKTGNVSFNCSKDNISFEDTRHRQPSIGGWSPAQSIVCATPRHNTVPSTPKDVANESLEQCSMKTIEKSQKKLLDELYGEVWKSIPTLFKAKAHEHKDLGGCSKKLQFDDDNESDKENIREDLRKNKELYLTGSDAKHKTQSVTTSDKKSKKKLYTERVPQTPSLPKQKPVKSRDVKTSVKKKKMTVTELVYSMSNDVELLAKKVESFGVTSNAEKRLSFMGSLAENIPKWRCHIEAIQYRDNFKGLKEQLTARLYKEFNKEVFGDQLDADMTITWDTKLRSTAGTTTNRLMKTSSGARIRSSSIKLSTKVLESPQRLRDTLVHEMCHCATWLLDGELRAGHGPLWKKWASRALKVFPELEEISRCHNLAIHFKYTYSCTKCGYSIQRHSKSIDITKKCCGICRGTFEIILNKKNKDGAVVSTPARKGAQNGFAAYVKENYGSVQDGTKTPAQVMKLLGAQFSAKKNKPS